MKVEEALKIANEKAYSDYHIHAGTDRIAKAKEWEKDGQKRVYIDIYCYTAVGRYKGKYKCGYVDAMTGEYVCTKYDDVNLAE